MFVYGYVIATKLSVLAVHRASLRTLGTLVKGQPALVSFVADERVGQEERHSRSSQMVVVVSMGSVDWGRGTVEVDVCEVGWGDRRTLCRAAAAAAAAMSSRDRTAAGCQWVSSATWRFEAKERLPWWVSRNRRNEKYAGEHDAVMKRQWRRGTSHPGPGSTCPPTPRERGNPSSPRRHHWGRAI